MFGWKPPGPMETEAAGEVERRMAPKMEVPESRMLADAPEGAPEFLEI